MDVLFRHLSRVITLLLALLAAFALAGFQTGAAQTGPDMVVSIAGPRTVWIGENITYTISATNVGDETATGVVLEAWAPDWYNPVGVHCLGGTALSTSHCAYASVAPGETVTMTATLQATIPFRTEHPFEWAWVTADVDVNLENNTAEIKVNIIGSRDH